MTINYGLIVDIVFVAVITLSVVLCAKKGLFKCISGIAGTIIGFIGAKLLSGSLAGVFEELIRPLFYRLFSGVKVQQALSDLAQKASGGITDMQSSLQQSLQESGVGEKVSELIGGVLDYMNTSMAEIAHMEASGTLAAKLSDGAADAVAPVAAFILLFAVIKLIVTLVCNLLSADIPVVSQVNAFGGAVLGLIPGVLTVALVCWGVLIFAPTESVGFLSQQTLRDSMIGGFFATVFG